MMLVDGRCSPVQAVHSTAMTGTQDPDLHEQHREPTQEEGDEEEEGEKVHVSVEGEEREQEGEEEEEEEEEKEELPYPTLAPVVLLALTQTSPPRSWCLRVVCHPYPSPQALHLKHCEHVCVSVYNVRETLSVCVSALYFLKAVVPTRHLTLKCLLYI
ncbi:hypothetical protein ABVT39_016279 [Epinephelus coioides]